ncbi:hypothetical protein MN608_06229 [Microdochium nivale]|nr:hypothetical protein MN608_06229 [Microdochium nivale]
MAGSGKTFLRHSLQHQTYDMALRLVTYNCLRSQACPLQDRHHGSLEMGRGWTEKVSSWSTIIHRAKGQQGELVSMQGSFKGSLESGLSRAFEICSALAT